MSFREFSKNLKMHGKSWENGFGLIYENKFSENCGKFSVNVRNILAFAVP